MKLQLHWQILIAIIAAIAVGAATGTQANVLGISFYSAYDFLGTLFLNALKMIVVPLVVSSIICGIANLGSGDNIGRLGGKTLSFYLLSSLFAILMGLFWVNILSPGIVDDQPAYEALQGSIPASAETKLEQVSQSGSGDFAAVFLRMLPPNIVDAAANGQMLGLICFSLLFGFFMIRTQKQHAETLVSFWGGVQATMMSMTMFIMKFAPIGVFGLVAKVVADTGFSGLLPMLVFMLTVILALTGHVFITLSLALRYVAKVNPLRHYRAMLPALMTGFSTASSSGTLPLTMECVEKNAGVSKKTTSFVLPLGATVNMDGTALYECVAAIFIAQAYGLDLTIVQQFTIVVVALLTSIGVAGIPAASLVAITVILAAIGLPAEGIALLMLTDRLLDMLRTAVNIFSDSCCAVIVARTEGEHKILQ